MGAPYNPFARTLATSEAPFGLQQAEEKQNADEEIQARPNAGRTMNVDEFKNILMTGSATPSSTSSIGLQRSQDNSSSTDTSSVSRQSLFDPMLEVHPETPRSSFDQMHSDSDDDNNGYNDYDHEGSKLMTGTGRLDDFAPPAPPKHTHGKTLAPTAPRTVSFDDFDTSPTTQDYAYTARASTGKKLGKRPAALHRTASDLNKPLPAPPPKSPVAPEHSIPNTLDQAVPPAIPSANPTETATAQKRAPPPPPVSRRAGQGSTDLGRNRSLSNSTPDAVNEGQSSVQSDSAATNSRPAAAPPPPPARKSQSGPQQAVVTNEIPPVVSSSTPSATDTKAMPAPPPRRKPGNALVRTPSSASQSSVSLRNNSDTPSNQQGPPAPPPRRAAKRESKDGPPNSMAWARKGSGTSFDSTERSTSMSSLTGVAEAGEAQNVTSPATRERDILADMTAFQAEIDALRQKAEKGG